MNQYKQQAIAAKSRLQQKQKYYKQIIRKLEVQLIDLKQQILNLVKQIEGQSKLIEQFHQKYDAEVKQLEMCLKLINQQKFQIQDLNIKIEQLQRTVASTRQVSVNLIKENQTYKAQILIEKDKYSLLYQDYGLLSDKYEQQIRQMYEQNRILLRKLDDVEMELKIHQKDKEIQNLLAYEDSIHKRQRQRERLIMDQASSSPPSVVYHKNSENSSPYDFMPRRLNFEDDPSLSGKNFSQNEHSVKQKSNGHLEIIQLQKSKISHLESQLKQYEKRNKQLQSLMLKFMK